MTLNLCDHLLTQARHFHELGVEARALRTFSHLARLRELPPGIAEETQFYLAELMLKQRKFAKARRHLAACLAHDDGNPECHYLMAYAHQEDRRGNRGTALEHYRRCVRLDPENALYHCDAGLFAMSQGETEEGLYWLRRAAELAAEDVEMLGDIVNGLQDQGYDDEARDIARTAMFHNSRDTRFRRLWTDLRFREVHRRQQQMDTRRVVKQAEREGRVALPFLKMTVQTPNGRKIVRQDGPSHTPSPHLLQFARLSGRKHA